MLPGLAHLRKVGRVSKGTVDTDPLSTAFRGRSRTGLASPQCLGGTGRSQSLRLAWATPPPPPCIPIRHLQFPCLTAGALPLLGTRRGSLVAHSACSAPSCESAGLLHVPQSPGASPSSVALSPSHVRLSDAPGDFPRTLSPPAGSPQGGAAVSPSVVPWGTVGSGKPEAPTLVPHGPRAPHLTMLCPRCPALPAFRGPEEAFRRCEEGRAPGAQCFTPFCRLRVRFYYSILQMRTLRLALGM